MNYSGSFNTTEQIVSRIEERADEDVKMEEEEEKQPPSAVMAQRWLRTMRDELPVFDLQDSLAMRDPLVKVDR